MLKKDRFPQQHLHQMTQSPPEATAAHPPESSTDEQVQTLRAELELAKSEAVQLRDDASGYSRLVSLLNPLAGDYGLSKEHGADGLLARILDERRQLREDLRVLELVARGTPWGDQPVLTDSGKQALESVVALVHAAEVRREQIQTPSLPAAGWSSPRAKALVASLPSASQPLLLGDLLEQLAPYAGETGVNETASDTLRRALKGRADHAFAHGVMDGALDEMTKTAERFKLAAEKLQDAMVARRAPDAESGAQMVRIQGLLVEHGRPDKDPVAAISHALHELKGLRAFLSPQPMVAVAVRDDGNEALAERYSLLVLEWDGETLTPSVIDGPSPWADLVHLLQRAVATRLVPITFR